MKVVIIITIFILYCLLQDLFTFTAKNVASFSYRLLGILGMAVATCVPINQMEPSQQSV